LHQLDDPDQVGAVGEITIMVGKARIQVVGT
jgi:hypothetical protein